MCSTSPVQKRVAWSRPSAASTASRRRYSAVARLGSRCSMRANWIVNPMPNNRLNMLLNLPEKSMSRRFSAN